MYTVLFGLRETRRKHFDDPLSLEDYYEDYSGEVERFEEVLPKLFSLIDTAHEAYLAEGNGDDWRFEEILQNGGTQDDALLDWGNCAEIVNIVHENDWNKSPLIEIGNYEEGYVKIEKAS